MCNTGRLCEELVPADSSVGAFEVLTVRPMGELRSAASRESVSVTPTTPGARVRSMTTGSDRGRTFRPRAHAVCIGLIVLVFGACCSCGEARVDVCAPKRSCVADHGSRGISSAGVADHYCDEYAKVLGCVTRRRISSKEQPKYCAGADGCVEIGRARVGRWSLTLFGTTEASVLQVTAPGQRAVWIMRMGDFPATFACNFGRPKAQCMVLDYGRGGKGSVTSSYLLTSDRVIPAGSVTTASDRADIADLNGDGYLDATLMQDHIAARGHLVYWETYVFNGERLAATGCGALQTQIGLFDSPSAPETGTCPR